MATATMEHLRDKVRGEIFAPEDPAYDEARRVYNAMIDRRPRVIVRCAGVDDVVAAVNFARDSGVSIAVRGGSHSVPGFGTADGAVVIDLVRMQGVDVDPAQKTARAEGGATWGEFNDATHAHGLATTGGIISTTGVGGLTLGGGIGYLSRGHGLSCDNLLSAEVVTADGRIVTASAHENEDLFWALRGGGGNFGVVTAFEYQLHPVREIYGGPIFFELSDAADVLRFYREFIRRRAGGVRRVPGLADRAAAAVHPGGPPGRAVPHLRLLLGGADRGGRGRAQADPRRRAGGRRARRADALPGAQQRVRRRSSRAGLQHYWKANFVRELTDDAIAAHIEHGPKVPTVNSTVHIYPINGACHRVAPDATAFAYRDATFATVIAGMWPDPADNDANTAWVRDYYDATAPHSEPGGYVNFMAGDDQERIKDNYRGNYDRLVEVKRKYDPDNLFHLNQNIKP